MSVPHRAGKFAFLLHADVAGSTSLVQQDEYLAHERIQAAFRRFGDTIARYHGRVRELRGDALLAEFERASDAVTAALVFQVDQAERNTRLDDTIRPTVRVGIAMGEVVIADRTVTGAGVVLAQRMEQLAEPGGVCITGAIHESLPQRMPFDQDSLGEREVKGFEEPVRAYAVRLRAGVAPPGPAELTRGRRSPAARWAMTAAIVVLICGSGLLAWHQFSAPGFEPASPEDMALPLSDKPSIAVLPFTNISDDPSFDYLSDGISEDIITALARSPWMLVMSRTSTFAFKGRAVTAQQIGKELGVHYVLEGSVQKGRDTVRVTAQLIDAADGNHLWAERFDRSGDDVLAIQDAVTEKINQTVGSLSGVLLGQAARQRAWRKAGVELEEYDYVLRGHSYFLQWTQDNMSKARAIFEQGLERFPDSSLLRAKVAWARFVEVLQGWSADPEADAASAIVLAERVLSDKRASLLAEYLAHWVLAYLYSRTDAARAMEEIETAVKLVPGNGMTRTDLAGFQFLTGRVEEGWKNLALAERIDPHYVWIIYYKAFGLRIQGDCRKAIETMQAFYESPLKHLFIAACLQRLDEPDKAKAALARAEELWPGVTVSAHRDTVGFAGLPVVHEYLEDLRKAGMPN